MQFKKYIILFSSVVFMGSHGVSSDDTLALDGFIENLNKSLSSLEGVEGKDVTVFSGPTGAGKTTLSALLSGCEFCVNDRGELHLKTPSDTFDVGGGDVSKTSTATVIPAGDGVLLDLPGFCDTRGDVQELINAAIFKKACERSKSLKLFLVLEDANISGRRGAHFNAMMTSLKSLFPKEFLNTCFAVIINKAPGKYAEHGRDIVMKRTADDHQSFVEELFNTGRFMFVPRPETKDFDISRHADSIRGMMDRISCFSGALALTPGTLMGETQTRLKLYFRTQMEMHLKIWPKSSNVLETMILADFQSQKDAAILDFKTRLQFQQPLPVLIDIASGIFNDVWDTFVSEALSVLFDNRYHELKAKMEEKRKIEAEKLRRAEEAKEAALKLQKEKEARELERARQRAESLRQQKAAEAERLEKERQASQRELGPLPSEKPSVIWSINRSKVCFYGDMTFGGDDDFNMSGGRVVGYKGVFNPVELWKKHKVVIE